MANATITGTASNFGSISGVLSGEAGTVSGTITGTVSGTLTGSVGVPGAGVPSGGTTGQVLKKVSNTDYDTTWGTDLASAAWGTITGTLSSQTDLQTALNLKADLASPALTGNPTAPTAATGDNDTTIATTGFVQQELAAGTAVAKNLEVYVRNQTGATLTAGTIVYINGATGNRPTVTKAQANNDANSAQTFGFIKQNIANNGFGYVIVRGELENVDTSALTEGQQLYLSPTTAGTWTTTKPSAPQHLVYVGICVRSHPTQGIILVAIQNGYELNELHDVKITSVSNGQVLKYDSAQGLWVNGTDSSGVAWGGITGTLSAQTDLQTALDGKANLSGDTFTGDVGITSSTTKKLTITNTTVGPNQLSDLSSSLLRIGYTGISNSYTYISNDQVFTGSSGTGTINIETSNTGGFQPHIIVQNTLGTGTKITDGQFLRDTGTGFFEPYASLASPALTGTPTAPTAAANTNTTQLATTAFVLGQGNTTAATIVMNGTQAAGTSNLYARADHVHPTDTTRAPLASPALTGTPTAPTASAGTNTTQIATTAFVQTAAPDASTTTKGKVQLATFTTPSPTDTSSAISPKVMMDHIMHQGFGFWGVRGSTLTSGAGASVTTYSTRICEVVGPNTLTAGYAMAVWDTAVTSFGMIGMTRGTRADQRAWNKPVWASGRGHFGYMANTTYNGDTNSVVRVSVGGKTAGGSGDISINEAGFGWYFVPGSAMVLQVSRGNGTALTNVTSSFTPVAREIFDWKMYSDGAGNVTLYINDSQVATTANGPSTSTPEAYNFYFEMVEQTASAATRILWMSINPKFYWGV